MKSIIIVYYHNMHLLQAPVFGKPNETAPLAEAGGADGKKWIRGGTGWRLLQGSIRNFDEQAGS
ncbi:hypothetical protein [Geobacter sp.]|uniref:hypothetical protein n=1 Tax=Geobacter sp. TaxID=46610 RepID=UPI0027B92CCD|nr:hypothetical protein [Geobacter sp.]